jgi:autotransporter-associated beta strand protein
MKLKTVLSTLFAALFVGAAAHAQTQSWTNISTDGLWNTTSLNWSDDGLGDLNWQSADAIFGSTSVGTVTIATGVSANSVTFNTAGYTITGGALTLTGAASITSNANATISSVIAGSAGLTTLGSGTLTLTSANTYTGATSVGAGRLVISGATAVSAFGSNTSVASGATLEFNNSADATIATPSINLTGAGTVVKSGAGTWYVGSGSGHVNFNLGAGGLLDIQSGTIQCNFGGTSFGSNLGSINLASGAILDFRGEDAQMDALTGAGTVESTWPTGGHVTVGVSGGSGTFAGVIYNGSGLPVNLIKNGAGTQTFAIRNEYTGSTTINAGRLVFQSFNSSNAYNIASGAALEFNYNSGPDSSNHSLGSATFSGSGTLVKTGDDTIAWGYGVGTFNMAAGSLIDVQAGTFAGSNGGGGVEIWTTNQSSLNIASGAVFRTAEGNVYVDALTGAGTFRIGAPTGWGYVNTTIGVSGGTGSFAGTVVDDYGAGNLVKTGAGTQTFSGANSYSGSTTINGGRLVFQNTNASSSYSIASGAVLEFNAASGLMDQATATFTGMGTLVKSGADTLKWGGGAATFAMSAGSLIDVQEGTFIGGSNGNEDWTSNQSSLNIASGATFTGVEALVRIDALTGAGSLRGGYSGTEYITIGVAGGSGTFSGGISNYGATFGLTKTGAGTQTLTGASSYTGVTTIAAGTLSAENDKALGDTSSVVVSGGILDIRGATAGTVTIGGGGNFTLSSGTVKLQLGTTFDQLVSSGAGTFSISGGTLALDVTGTGFSYGNTYQVFFGFGVGNTVSGLTITGYDTADWSASLDNTGLLSFTAVPEPSTWAMLLGGVGMLTMFRRRRA